MAEVDSNEEFKHLTNTLNLSEEEAKGLKEKLNIKLQNLFDKFSSYQEETFCAGICLPLLRKEDSSYVCVRFVHE